MKFKFTKQFGLIVACLLVGATAFAQLRTPVDIATEHVKSHFAEWGLTAQDIDGMTVSDQYTDPTTGIARVYFIQRYQNIPVYNAILNVNITADGKVFHVGKRFVPNLLTKVNNTIPVLDAEAAVVKLMQHLDIPYAPLRFIGKNDQDDFVFEKGTIAQQDIKARLSFQQYGSAVLLAWDISLVPNHSSDMWSCRVDAVTGDLLDKANWTVYCKVDHTAFMHTDKNCEAISNQNQAAVTSSFNMAADGTYNVWPWPIESPKHGPRTMVTDPYDLSASPFGWHDSDGQPGPEYTITRGNNVHAYEDSGDMNTSIDNEPDGGASLVFDFPYDALLEPVTYTDAAVVNLFYWNNVMHDMSYSYGMTEAAGAFQDNNYGNGGAGNDHVNAEAQDGGGTNNANFSTPADGGSGRMQMYLWSPSAGEIFNVTEPASVAGGYPSAQPATGWGTGSYATTTGVTAPVTIVEDVLANPYFSDACEQIVNSADLVGKIALIDRGGCEFGFKALAAQNAGAVGVIICNFEDATIGMAPGAVGAQVEIPVVMLTSVNCQTIRQFAGNGLVASIKQPDLPSGPVALDGDLDNGVIAHEYGHGISNRLTGGPNQAGCLGNAEQMGEGWSDFFALITTVEPGDAGTDKRGVGTYAGGEEITGQGIRRYPYSTDMNVNPLTYGDVAGNTEVHALGEVWTTMVWDLYWAFVDEYGWDPDLYHGTGGNNMAIRLIYDGMKNQPCNPGFLDGRDGILAADVALNGGANKCLIWKTFARRGAGLSAVQGTSDSASDQVEAFDIPCECRDEVTIVKSVTDFIDAGDDINVTINVSNCRLETRTNVVVTDELPDGTTYKAGSANVPATVSGNVITLELGDIDFEETVNVTYTLGTDPDKYSIRFFLDDVPTADAEDNWEQIDLGAPEPNIFQIDDTYSHSPDFAWLVPDIALESRTALELKTPWTVIGERPTLRFYHLYDTEPGADAGLIDVKKATDNTYQQVDDKMLRGGYPSQVQYGTFITPNLYAWSGTTNGEFIPTYVDLRDWLGQDLVFRFRFGTDDNTEGPLGWVVDDIEFMDLLSYNGEACVTTGQGDNKCTIAPEEGTIVESQFFSSTVEKIGDMTMNVFPNPAKDVLNIALTTESQKDVSLSLLTIDGKVMMEKKGNLQGNGHFQVNVSQLPAGFYFVKVATKDGVLVTKVVVE
ncbi:MAG: T9SS type A sorting domain-containing protein [Bacteroidetes bacterium]|nr:T9SS type A sorting domain-containing protein [Bacteroidota bacterium]